MSEKRFVVIDDDFSKWVEDTTYKEDKHEGTLYDVYDMCTKLNELVDENEQLEKGKMEALSLLGEEIDKNEQLRQLLAEYRKTNKHLSELCADATKNGYLPHLEHQTWKWKNG